MFLEPIYLNEVMLMNCASYLFKGVSLKAETVSTTEDTKGMEGQVDANSEGGISFLGNLAKLSGGLSLQGNKNNLQSYQNTMERTITLGSLHMDVIDRLKEEEFINETNSENLINRPSSKNYVEIQAVLQPVDLYSVLELLKLVLEQLEKLFDLAGEALFKPKNGKNQSKKVLHENIEKYIGTAKALSELIEKIESDYQSSNQLEMIMIDDKGKEIGVLDIDVKNKSLNEIKAQLTDGEFIVFGKIIRYVEEGEDLSLVQRSLLSALSDKLNKVVSVMSMFELVNENENKEWEGFIVKLKNALDKMLVLSISGPAVRVKAMSVCM